MWSLLVTIALARDPEVAPVLSGRVVRIEPTHPDEPLPDAILGCHMSVLGDAARRHELARQQQLDLADDMWRAASTEPMWFESSGYRSSIALEDGTTILLQVVGHGSDTRDIRVRLRDEDGTPLARKLEARLTRGDAAHEDLVFLAPGDLLLRDVPMGATSRLQLYLPDGSVIALWLR